MTATTDFAKQKTGIPKTGLSGIPTVNLESSNPHTRENEIVRGFADDPANIAAQAQGAQIQKQIGTGTLTSEYLAKKDLKDQGNVFKRFLFGA